jgi:dsRNA-specific ribonuclease
MNAQRITRFPGTGAHFYYEMFKDGRIVASGWAESREQAKQIMAKYA